MRTFTTAFMLVLCVCTYAQTSRSMHVEVVAQQLSAELQSNSQDNEFQRGIRFRVTVNPGNEITIQQTWLQNNGQFDQMVLSFHPRNIIDVDKRYHRDAMGLAVQCQDKTVANYWLDYKHMNSSFNIPCLKDDIEAVVRIEETLLQLKELCQQDSYSVVIR